MKYLSLLGCVLLSLLCLSCSGYSATGGPGPLVASPQSAEVIEEFDFSQVRDVVVLPISGAALRELPLELLHELDRELLTALSLHTELQIRNHLEADAVAAHLAEVTKSAVAQSRAVDLLKRADADGVFHCVLHRYRNSTSKTPAPAEISFRLWFTPRGSQKAVWVSTFELRQQALSENLFRVPRALREGVRFKSAEGLFREGMRLSAQAFEKAMRESSQVN